MKITLRGFLWVSGLLVSGLIVTTLLIARFAPEPPKQLQLPAHRLLRDEAPVRGPVHRLIVIDEPANRDQIESILRRESQRARAHYSRLVSGSAPRRIGVYAFSSEERANAGEGLWVAMLWSDSVGDSLQAIEFSETRLSAAWAAAETRFGLDESARMRLWDEVVREEDRARADAHGQYPLANELRLKYLRGLAKTHGIGIDTLFAIEGEGIDKGWPSPPAPRDLQTPPR